MRCFGLLNGKPKLGPYKHYLFPQYYVAFGGHIFFRFQGQPFCLPPVVCFLASQLIYVISKWLHQVLHTRTLSGNVGTMKRPSYGDFTILCGGAKRRKGRELLRFLIQLC